MDNTTFQSSYTPTQHFFSCTCLGGGGGAACSERGPESCGHTTCTYTDSGCVPNLEFVGVMDEFGK